MEKEKFGCAVNRTGKKSDSTEWLKCDAACVDLGDKLPPRI